MGTLVDFSKLAELRARTDRDLVRILNADLERSLALASVAATRHSVFRSQAEAMYTRAKTLLPKLSGLTADELAQLEAKLKELGMALDLVPGTMDLEEEPAAVCEGSTHAN
jgi:hypothetical protein